jgi:photosystem II stability/assembly factor-like uncharacterized protein
MAGNGTILVGTVGQGVHRSADGGETWVRAGVGQGMHSDAVVRCLTTHPAKTGSIFAGSDLGLYRSADSGGSWKLLETPMNGQSVWSVVCGEDPDFIIAGTGTPSRPRLFFSEDGGETWAESRAEIAEECPAVGVPRPTAIAIDPSNPRSVWAGIEVDGVRRSRDGGRTWERAATEIKNPDVHNLLITPDRIFVLVNDDLWISGDAGKSFRPVGVREVFPWHYPRGIAGRPDDPNTVFVTIGDTTPGRTGAVMRSKDAGETWESLPLGCQPNSAMWTLTIADSDPDLIFAASRYGYLYKSENGGDSWVKLWREFSEVSSIAVLDG